MKTLLITCAFVCNSLFSYSQTIYQIRADSVRIYNTCDTAELILENRTQNVPGFLYNKGRGRTEFRRLQLSNLGNGLISISDQDTLDFGSSLNGQFIRNQFSAGQNADYWIKGRGRIDSTFTLSKYKNNETEDSVLTTDVNGNIKMKIAAGGKLSLQDVTDNGDSTTHSLLIGGNNAGAGLYLSNDVSSGDFGFSNAYITAVNSGTAAEMPGNINFYGYALFFSADYAISFQRSISVNGSVGTTGSFITSGDDGRSVVLGQFSDGVTVGSNTNHPLIFKTFETEKARITPTGNMGIGTTNPTAKLEVAGQVKITGGTPGAGKVLTSDANGLASWQNASGASSLTAITTVTANIILDNSHYTVLANNVANINITLPAASANTGRIYFIKKISANTSSVTILPGGSDTIDGGTNYTLSSANKCIQVQSDGSGWYILTVM